MAGAYRMMAVNRDMPRLTVLPHTRGPLSPVVATDTLPESILACRQSSMRMCEGTQQA